LDEDRSPVGVRRQPRSRNRGCLSSSRSPRRGGPVRRRLPGGRGNQDRCGERAHRRAVGCLAADTGQRRTLRSWRLSRGRPGLFQSRPVHILAIGREAAPIPRDGAADRRTVSAGKEGGLMAWRAQKVVSSKPAPGREVRSRLLNGLPERFPRLAATALQPVCSPNVRAGPRSSPPRPPAWRGSCASDKAPMRSAAPLPQDCARAQPPRGIGGDRATNRGRVG
jgi:hypothetical protein